MNDTPVVDADVVDDPPAGDAPPDAITSTSLTVVEPNAGAIIRSDDPREILVKAKQIAEPLAELIESAGLAKALGGQRKHVEVGGWQACGTLLGALGGQPLHAETVWTRKVTGDDGRPVRTTYTATVKRYHKREQGGGLREEITYDVDGYDWEACVEVKTPSGVVVGRAEAMVGRAENTWAQRDDYALRSMAETRAESRAWRKAIGWIVHIAGYNPTPAEEMGHTPGADTPTQQSQVGGIPTLPPWATAISDEQKGTLRTALATVFGSDERGIAFAKAISQKTGDGVPGIVAATIKAIAPEVAKLRAPQAAVAGDDPVGDASDPSYPPPAADDDDTPPADSVDISKMLAGEAWAHADDDTKRGMLRTAGCICTPTPLPGDQGVVFNDHCPIQGHGIPF